MPDGGTTAPGRGELAGLLHARLRVVALISLCPMLLFLIRNFFGDPPTGPSPANQALHGVTTVVLAVLAAALWARPAYSLRHLRGLELALFGSLAGFFGFLQVRQFDHPELFHIAARHAHIELDRLWINASATRWFFLIVIYGVFIPNTWRRCLAVAGAGAAAPVALSLLGAVLYDHLDPEVMWGLFDLTVLMGTALAVAVFGAHRFQVLHQEALQARRLGQYRLKQRLGGGGMGEVFLAEHVLLRRPCAVKLIHPDQAGDPAALGRFEREVQALAALTHPNTVEVYDYGHAEDGTFYYAMEYLPGMNLEALVHGRGLLPPARVIHFLRQVCGALREAHHAGLLHRDVKPSNVIACERGGVHDVAKLVDFGLVHDGAQPRESVRLTTQGTVLGSPPYMAPEQAQGKPVDARADLYGLAGVGYFLLTGQPPFLRETPMEMMLAHAYVAVVPPSALVASVPADLEAVIVRGLSKKPEDRYATTEALDRALAACADAGKWTEEQAAAWWAAGPHGDTVSQEAVALNTPRTA
jgi:hypothetical protein